MHSVSGQPTESEALKMKDENAALSESSTANPELEISEGIPVESVLLLFMRVI